MAGTNSICAAAARKPKADRRAIIRAWKAEQLRQVIERSQPGRMPGLKACVLYVRQDATGKRQEVRTPWFLSRERAHAAREIMARKYGGAIVYVD